MVQLLVRYIYIKLIKKESKLVFNDKIKGEKK